MKHIVLSLSMLLSTLIVAQNSFPTRNNSKTVKISGTVTRTSTYCGGANPGQDVLDELATPHPYSGMKLYARKGAVNDESQPIADTAITAADGTYSFDLPAGTYCIITEEQVRPLDIKALASDPYVIATSEDCVKKWWRDGLKTIEVGDKDIKQVNFEFYGRCFITSDCPCLQYEGPMPP